MSSAREYDVTFYKRLPEDKAKGRRKGHFKVVGKAFEFKDGKIDIHLDSIPINFDGRLTLFDHGIKDYGEEE